MILHRITFILLWIGLSPFTTWARSYIVDPGQSKITFSIIKFKIGAPVEGTFGQFNGEVEMSENTLDKVNITIKTDSVNTEDEKRDAHLKTEDFFYTQKYPEMTFVIQEKALIKNHFNLKGVLTIKGRSRNVTLLVKKLSDQEFQAETEINRLDYGVSWNKNLEESAWKSVAGILGKTILDDSVKIKIKAILSEKK